MHKKVIREIGPLFLRGPYFKCCWSAFQLSADPVGLSKAACLLLVGVCHALLTLTVPKMMSKRQWRNFQHPLRAWFQNFALIKIKMLIEQIIWIFQNQGGVRIVVHWKVCKSYIAVHKKTLLKEIRGNDRWRWCNSNCFTDLPKFILSWRFYSDVPCCQILSHSFSSNPKTRKLKASCLLLYQLGKYLHLHSLEGIKTFFLRFLDMILSIPLSCCSIFWRFFIFCLKKNTWLKVI